MYIYTWTSKSGWYPSLNPTKNGEFWHPLKRNQVLAPRLEGAETSCGHSPPSLALASPQADEAGTEPDPERDEILAAQVVLGLGVFRGDGWGRPAFLFGWESIRRLLYIYASYICIYFCFAKCNNRFMMSKKISNGSPPKKWWMLGWCWACFCLGIQTQKGRELFSLTPKNQGFGTHLKLKQHLSMTLGVSNRFAGDFFSGGRV